MNHHCAAIAGVITGECTAFDCQRAAVDVERSTVARPAAGKRDIDQVDGALARIDATAKRRLEPA